jgi:hypothetical protein
MQGLFEHLPQATQAVVDINALRMVIPDIKVAGSASTELI